MSIQAIAWVLEHSTARLGPRLALLSIANHAHPDGTQAFPSYDTIAKEAHLSKRQAVRAVQALIDQGHVRVVGSSPLRTNVYVICGLADGDNLSPTSGGKGQWRVTNQAGGEVTNPTVDGDISGSTGVGNVTRTVQELTVQEPPEGQIAAADAAPSANGKGKDGKPFHLADVVNLNLVVSLRDRYRRRGWEKSITEGLLTGLVLGSESKKLPACGPKAVNAAIEDLYEHAAGVKDPAGYLKDRAAAYAMGYERIQTFILGSEPGTSLRAGGMAAGWRNPGGTVEAGSQANVGDYHLDAR